MNESRQVVRARARKNDYWAVNKWGRLQAPDHPRACRRENASNRALVSCRIIRAKTPRERLSKSASPRHPNGMRHAWQRKAAAAKAFRELIERRDGAAR
jgi:hypothetical protein